MNIPTDTFNAFVTSIQPQKVVPIMLKVLLALAVEDLHIHVVEISFLCLGNKEISVLFSTKCCLFQNVIFSCSNDTFYINHVLKFKYPPR